MLELKNIAKDYVNGNNVTHALKGISVNFRKNEFVSILGASGCGKTTTLNIIGGLDRYTKGDLKINGKSTKKYTDRDWDTYRNHSVGFIFQTYNLIAHQNILKNVELALTIAGVSKEERKARAMEALKKVGLEGMEKKKPNQLSGGQCQRVAIARALINNPEILLADEPTGALDSETSIQIMELLKDVAKDRLVIMVTHNPDLAYTYSTRIIKMSDGLLTDDSNPFDGVEKIEQIDVSSKGKKKKTSMSLFTSIGLSTSNLLSKLRRTILVTIAGSIGIIGVSAVLAVSRGVKDYIGVLQNDMLSNYPITIQEEAVDYTALMSGLDKNKVKEEFKFNPERPEVGVDSMINYLMNTYSDLTNVKTNKIDDDLIAYVRGLSKEDAPVIRENYGIDVTNNIFGKWNDSRSEKDQYITFNGITQRYVSELNTVKGFSTYSQFADLFRSSMHELPENLDYVSNQYDVIAGDKLEGFEQNDLVLVVGDDVTLTDVLFAQLGFFEHDEFINVARCALAEQELKKQEDYPSWSNEKVNEELSKIREANPYRRSFSMEDVLNSDFYYFPQNTIYSEEKQAVAENEISFDISISVIESGDLNRFVSLSFQSLFGFNLLYGNTIYKNDKNEYETKTIACINADILYKKDVTKKEELDGTWYAFDQQVLLDLFARGANFDDETLISELAPKLEFGFVLNSQDPTFQVLFSKLNSSLNPTEIHFISPIITEKSNPITGYSYSAVADDDWIKNPKAEGVDGEILKIKSIVQLQKDKHFGCLQTGLYYTKAFADKFRADSADGRVTKALCDFLKNPATYQTNYREAYVTYDYLDYSEDKIDGVLVHGGYAPSLNGGFDSAMNDLFSGITGVNYFEKNTSSLRCVSGLKTIPIYDENEEFIGAEFDDLPYGLTIYPESFEAKENITSYLDKWNEDVDLTIGDKVLARTDREEISYSDTIEIIVDIITSLINGITIALVAFTSLSLVVSCFMIAVITYISVVERIKEIGVIRSLGGRKRDVANLFVTETFLTGLFSGVFGIVITFIIELIVNPILEGIIHFSLMHLTIIAAAIMILVSVVLSVVSGLVPSQSAAHKDPVVALRSNE